MRQMRRIGKCASAALAPLLSSRDYRHRLIIFGGEQLGQLFHHRAAELLSVHQRDGPTVVACNIVAYANGNKLHRAACFDVFDHFAQVALEVVARVDGQRGIIHWRAVADHHRYASLFLAGSRRSLTHQRLAVDVLFQDAFAQHQTQALACPTPGRVCRLVNDVAEIVQTAGIERLPFISQFSRDCPPFHARVVKPRSQP